MATIKIPIKCSTVRTVFDLSDRFLNELFNHWVFKWVVKWVAIGLFGIVWICLVSFISFIAGAAFFGSLIGIAAGHGNESLGSNWFTILGGIIGIVMGWTLIVMHEGYLKIVCMDG
jgi:hypothetical protein